MSIPPLGQPSDVDLGASYIFPGSAAGLDFEPLQDFTIVAPEERVKKVGAIYTLADPNARITVAKVIKSAWSLAVGDEIAFMRSFPLEIGQRIYLIVAKGDIVAVKRVAAAK